MAPGRNDPCPCGSGKKYKRCCFIKEKVSLTTITPHLLQKTSDEVVSMLLEYAEKTYGNESLLEAWDVHWSDVAGETVDSDNPYLQVFIPWYIFQWYPEEYHSNLRFPSKHTVVARFLKENGRKLGNFTQRFLESAQREPLSFWQVEAIEYGKGMLIKDFVLERECFVYEDSGTKTIKKWDILFGQVVGLDEEYILAATGPYPLQPSMFREYIKGFTDRIKESNSHCVNPVDFLEFDVDFVACYKQCVEDLLNPPIPKLHNTDGQKLVFTITRYAFPREKREEILQKLNSMRNIECVGDDGEESEFLWIVESRQKRFERTTKGNIRIGEDYIQIECNSRSRDREVRTRVENFFGRLIEYEGTDYKPFELDELKETTEDPEHEDLDNPPEEVSQEFVEMVEGLYMRWADDKVPALENQTPKEAVKDPGGRDKVVAMINDWENMDLRDPERPFRFDFNKLRNVLGLEGA